MSDMNPEELLCALSDLGVDIHLTDLPHVDFSEENVADDIHKSIMHKNPDYWC